MSKKGTVGINPVIAVIIPAYKVSQHILDVLSKIGPEVDEIYVVDDFCPEGSGKLVSEKCRDSRVRVIRNEMNLGVGGAVKAGFRAAMNGGAKVLVKIDGDGQINPSLIPQLVAPLLDGSADYAKGNRFFNVQRIKEMPLIRIIGNLGLSFYSKLSSGYWDIFDPNNGFIAIRSETAGRLPFSKISDRYFFESDMLFRLNLTRAVVIDIPMEPVYGEEVSSLKVLPSIFEFSYKHIRNFLKRIVYNYYLREFNLASLELLLGSSLIAFGVFVGGRGWIHSLNTGVPTQTGTLILTAMTFLSGLQLILGFFAYDISDIPRRHAFTQRKSYDL